MNDAQRTNTEQQAREALDAHGPIDRSCRDNDECLAQNVVDLLAELEAERNRNPLNYREKPLTDAQREALRIWIEETE
jgi:hypothetical protein